MVLKRCAIKIHVLCIISGTAAAGKRTLPAVPAEVLPDFNRQVDTRVANV